MLLIRIWILAFCLCNRDALFFLLHSVESSDPGSLDSDTGGYDFELETITY